MALLSSDHFEKEALVRSLSRTWSRSDSSHVPDHLGSVDDDYDDDFELTYSLGYSFASQRSDVELISINEDDEQLSSEYVAVEAFPFEKFSVFRCFREDRRVYYKNVYALSLVFLFLIGAHEGLVGIQTTINSDKGRVALAVENALLVCSVVIAPAVIWLLGIHKSILMACVLQICYVVSNYFRRYYTLIPGAIVGGFSLGIVWVAANLYKSIMAANVAKVTGVRPTVVIGKFGGVFYTFVSISLMLGNLISSMLFIVKEPVTSEEINCSLNDSMSVCSCDVDSEIVDNTRFILVSIYVVADVVAIVLLLLTVDNVAKLVTDTGRLRVRIMRYLRHSIISIVRVHFSTKASLLIPVFMLEGLQAAYYLSTFTTVSCCLKISCKNYS